MYSIFTNFVPKFPAIVLHESQSHVLTCVNDAKLIVTWQFLGGESGSLCKFMQNWRCQIMRCAMNECNTTALFSLKPLLQMSNFRHLATTFGHMFHSNQELCCSRTREKSGCHSKYRTPKSPNSTKSCNQVGSAREC